MLVRSLPLLLLAALLALLQAPSHAAASRLQCGVCEAIVDEVNAGIAETTLTHSVQTRFRVDEKKRIPYARTEHNLLEIIEGAGFSKRFDKYGVVKPHTKSATAMRQAYANAAAGITPEPEPEPEPEQPAAEPAEEPVYTTGDAADAAAAAAPPKPTKPARRVPYIPPAGATLPLALEHHHAHLVPVETLRSTGVLFDSSSEVVSEIQTEVNRFVDAHLDELILLFHKDVPELKHKLCREITDACAPTKKGKKQQQQGDKKKKNKTNKAAPAAATKDAPPAAADPAVAADGAATPQKDEL